MNLNDIRPSYDELLKNNLLLSADNAELKSQVDLLNFQLLDLRRKLFGSKSERFLCSANTLQIQLGFDIEPLAEERVQQQEVKEHTRQKATLKPRNHKGRMPFGSHIPREVVVMEPQESTMGLKKIGVDVTETLEYDPARFYIKRVERPKYATPGNQGVVMTPMKERTLGKSMFGNSFAAYVLVNKFVDHLPEYRQRQILKREDIDIATSSFNEISAKVAHCLSSAYDILRDQVLSSCYLQVDETPNRVLTNEKKGTTHQGYYWVYRCPLSDRVFFDYRPSRNKEGPRQMLKEFKGVLQTDGYSVYDEFSKQDGITLSHCWAHARRYFEKALDNDQKRARFMMEQIQLLYHIERKSREQNLSFEQRLELRKRDSAPVLNTIKEWIDQNTPSILPKSPIGKAILYTAKRWKGLSHYLSSGILEIDNNWVENNIRPLTLGRKNYLFAGSHQGAKRAAILYSFFATCKLKNINPYTWMKDTLDQLPFTNAKQLYTLLP